MLFATSSFWQGVDVVGESLSCVIIDKLPFASPGDPITSARIEAINADGGNAFAEYQIPLAILALQQGLGRLIRHRQDRGVLAVLDPRLQDDGLRTQISGLFAARTRNARPRNASISSSMPDIRAGAVRPILKWAGGKRQLLPELRPFYPRRFDRYFEPFLGSGAVFLDLHNGGLLDGRDVRCRTSTPTSSAATARCATRSTTVIGGARGARGRLPRRAARRTSTTCGTEAFNPERRRIMAAGDPAGAYTPSLAAMLIFLNRTGFNGLFRVNARGEFNVPAGRYANPKICDEAEPPRLERRARQPSRRRSSVSPFDAALADAGQDDFIYLDPPYAPLSGTARFTSYTAGGFDDVQQEALQRAVIALGRPRRLGPAQQFRGARKSALLYAGRGAARHGRAPGHDRGGPARDQLTGGQPGSGPRIPHYERPPV